MAITIHAGKTQNSLFVTNENAAARHAAEKAKDGNKKTIFAGELGVRQDSILVKRQRAQRQAMKVLGDTFAADRKLDQSVEEMKTSMEEAKVKSSESRQELKKIADKRSELVEYYGVDEDSQEHQDLELLRKERESKANPMEVELSDEEKEHLKEIYAKGLTKYQTDMLELDEHEAKFQDDLEKSEEKEKSLRTTLADTKIERLKSSPMLKAQEEAEDIMEAANKEIIGDLINESKKHIEEKMAEEKEKAEKRAEKKEEEDKKKEAAEERKAEMEEWIEGTKEAAGEKAGELSNASDLDQISSYNHPEQSKSKVEKEIEEILDELKLIQDDLKGAAVDTSL